MSNIRKFRAAVLAGAMTVAGFFLAHDAHAQPAQATKPATTKPVVTRTVYEQTPHRRLRGPNYEIVRMHQPRSEKDAVMGPAIAVLNADGRLVIVNYSRPGSPASDKQRQWIEGALEAAAKRSKAGILYLDVQVMRVNEQDNTVDIAYMPNLLGALKHNRLGKDGAAVPFDPAKDRPLFPYAEIIVNHQTFSSFSYSFYPQNGTDEQRRDAILSELLTAIDASNAAYKAR